MEPPVGLREEDNTTEPSESLKQRVKENQIKLKEIDEDYFSDLEGYIKYTREEDIENLTYPQFVDKHYHKDEEQINTYGDDDWATPTEEENILQKGDQNDNDGLYYGDKEENKEINLITTTDDLTEEEIVELSREIAKTETPEKLEPIKPTKKDLEKLSKVLNIKYNDDDVPLDRLTDTTQTLITKVTDKDNEKQNSGDTITYKGRK